MLKDKQINLYYKLTLQCFFVLNFFEIYSVNPKNFLFKNVDLLIGPLINLLEIPDFKILNAVSKQFLI